MRWVAALGAFSMAVALAGFAPREAALGWRVAFLTGGAPLLGAVLLLLIARVVGADWGAFRPLAAPVPLLLVGVLPIVGAQWAAELPDHLRLWANPWAVGVRGLIAVALFAFAARRVAGASRSFAAVALALYAVLVSPVAFDWLLGMTPGHSVSAAGMMLACAQVGGACAALLLTQPDARIARDMGGMLVAAALGLSYLAFMDYVIHWYGDLPERVAWYVPRVAVGPSLVAAAALLLGLGVPIVALGVLREPPARRMAGASALAGLFLFNCWWVGGGLLAAAVALLLAAGCWLAMPRRRHG